MATLGTGAWTTDTATSVTSTVTPPASCTVMVGTMVVGYEFTTLTVSALTWAGNDMTDGPAQDETGEDIYTRIDYSLSDLGSADDVVGGGGASAQRTTVGGIGVAGSATSDVVRDSASGTVSGGADIAWTPTGDVNGDAKIIVVGSYNADIEAGTSTTEQYDHDQTGNFSYSEWVGSRLTSGAVNVACDDDAAYSAISIKDAAAGGGGSTGIAVRAHMMRNAA